MAAAHLIIRAAREGTGLRSGSRWPCWHRSAVVTLGAMVWLWPDGPDSSEPWLLAAGSQPLGEVLTSELIA